MWLSKFVNAPFVDPMFMQRFSCNFIFGLIIYYVFFYFKY